MATRNAVTSAINVLGSDLVITSYSVASSDYGFSGQVETTVSTTTEKAIPFEEFKNLLREKFGDIESAGFELALKYTASFDIEGTTKYKVDYQGDTYDIIKIKRYAIEDTLVAWIISVSKRFT